MVAFIIFGLIFALPPIVFGSLLDKEVRIKECRKNREINNTRYIKTDYEFDPFDFVVNEKIKLENEHEKTINRITKKYGNDVLLYEMSPDDLDKYMKEQSYYSQKLKFLHEGLMNFYKNK